MKRKTKVLSGIVFATALLVATSTCSYAASKKDTKAVKKTVESFAKACSNYDVKKIKSFYKNPSTAKVFSSKKYTAKVVKQINKSWFDYDKAYKIKIKGKKATAKIDFGYLDLPYEDIYESAFDDMVAYYSKHRNASDLSIDKIFAKSMKRYYTDCLNSGDFDEDEYPYEPYNYAWTTITIHMQKIGSKWKIIKTSKNILDAIHCGYQSAYRYYFY